MGVRSSKKPPEEDSYFGSGKQIIAAIKKYGKENFQKRILQTFNSKEDMFAAEREIVNEDFVKRRDTYNMCVGGSGGDKISLHPELDRIRKLHSKLVSERASIMTPEQRSKLFGHDKNKGRTQSIKTKEKLKAADTGKKARNTVWMHNEFKNSRIPRDYINEAYAQGFLFGYAEGTTNLNRSGIKMKGWAGRSKFIHNGKIARKIPIDSPIPEGWLAGKPSGYNLTVKPKERKVCIHNGITTKRIPVSAQVPDGWQLGRHYKPKP